MNNKDTQFNAQLYPANFDDSAFKQYTKNEFNKLSEDACYKIRREEDNKQRLKHFTTNFVDLANAQVTRNNFFGIDIQDNMFVPAPQVIDEYSSLVNSKNGGQLTNCKVRNGFGQLPIQAPYRGQAAHGDVDIEDSIRIYLEPKYNSCLPKDPEYQKRSFAIFDDSQRIETPDAQKSVENKDNGFEKGRVGLPSRFQAKFLPPKSVDQKVNISNVQPYNME